MSFVFSWLLVDRRRGILNTVIRSILDCKALLCDFHREQAWERWASQTANGVVAYKEEILTRLRGCFCYRTIRVGSRGPEELQHLENQLSLTSVVPRNVAGRTSGQFLYCSSYLNNRVFLSRNYRLIVAPWFK